MLKVMIISKGVKSWSSDFLIPSLVYLGICGFMFQKFSGWDKGSVICSSKS